MTTIWVAGFSYGKGSLVKTELIKETEKSWMVGSTTQRLFGYSCIPKRLSKAGHNVFFTGEEAMEFLIGKAEVHIERQRAAVQSAIEHRDYLTRIAANATDIDAELSATRSHYVGVKGEK